MIPTSRPIWLHRLHAGKENHLVPTEGHRHCPELFPLGQSHPVRAEAIQADIADREAILRIAGKYDYIIHCAPLGGEKKVIGCQGCRIIGFLLIDATALCAVDWL